MHAVEIITAKIKAQPVNVAYDIVRQLGGGYLACEHERMVRACAYDALESRLGTDAVDALMDEVCPGWRD
jgi:hypothetical protein